MFPAIESSERGFAPSAAPASTFPHLPGTQRLLGILQYAISIQCRHFDAFTSTCHPAARGGAAVVAGATFDATWHRAYSQSTLSVSISASHTIGPGAGPISGGDRGHGSNAPVITR